MIHPIDQTSTVRVLAMRLIEVPDALTSRIVRPSGRSAYITYQANERVSLVHEHDFWRAIPSCGDVFGHDRGVLVWCRVESSAQTEVADLQLTVRIHEQIARLEVSMYH